MDSHIFEDVEVPENFLLDAFTNLYADITKMLDDGIYDSEMAKESLVYLQAYTNPSFITVLSSIERVEQGLDIGGRFIKLAEFETLLPKAFVENNLFLNTLQAAGLRFTERLHKACMEVLGWETCPGCNEKHDYALIGEDNNS